MNLKIEDLSISYSASKILFKDANLNVDQGNLVALVGRNGTGKSTLLRTLLSLHTKGVDGKIFFGDTDVRKMSSSKRADIFSYVSTSIVETSYLLVKEVVAMGRFKTSMWSGKLSPLDEKIVEQSLDCVGALELSSRYVSSLSDGERQRVMIAKAIAQETPVIILDEPTAFLDVPGRIAITSLLSSLAKTNNKLVIYSTHEIDLAKKFADIFWVIDNCQVNSYSSSLLQLPAEFEFLV